MEESRLENQHQAYLALGATLHKRHPPLGR
jgi:hypothetical protein